MMSEAGNTAAGLGRSFGQWLVADRRRVIGAVLLLVILYWSQCYSSRPIDNSVLSLSEEYRREVLNSLRQTIAGDKDFPRMLFVDDYQKPEYLWERVQLVRDKIKELPFETHDDAGSPVYIVQMPAEFGLLGGLERLVLIVNVRLNAIDYRVSGRMVFAWEDPNKRVRCEYNGNEYVLSDDGQGMIARKKLITGYIQLRYITNKKEIYELLDTREKEQREKTRKT